MLIKRQVSPVTNSHIQLLELEMTDLILYYWPGACSLAAHIVLEESGIPFRAERVDFASGAQRSPQYRAINPKGRVPALEENGIVLTENPAILAKLGRLAVPTPGEPMWPDEGPATDRCAEWASWLASTVHVTFAHVSRVERYADSPEARAEVSLKGAESCRPLWDEIERALQGREWIIDDRYSVIDAYLQVFWNWGRGPRLGYDMEDDFPAWTSHARRVHARAAVQRTYATEGIVPP